MIINVIMPTYKDEKTIINSLNSIKNQTYSNWHLYIVNDGSPDNTEKIVKKYIKGEDLSKKITYVYEDNSDQLNAIKNGLSHIPNNSGLIFVLHSDDTLADDKVFENAVKYFETSDADAIIADYNIMNESSKIIGYQKVRKYKKSDSTIALLALWLGRNLFVDVAFWKYAIYKKYVFYNYLTWNTPFWFCHEEKLDMLNVKNVNFPFFNYRVFEENYINNEVGLLNVLSGEVRTLLLVLSEFSIPFYRVQYYLFRIFSKMHINYKVIYNKRPSTNIYNILKYVILKRISRDKIQKYPYYDSLLEFFKIKSKHTIKFDVISDNEVYVGADARKFNKKMIENNLPDIYYKLFDEMKKGFDEVIVNKNNVDEIMAILKFLGIYRYVRIVKK